MAWGGDDWLTVSRERRWSADFPPLAEAVVLQLQDALYFLKLAGVVHGDIKPNNVTINVTERRVCLIDFDLAEKVGIDGWVPGSRAYYHAWYRAPELHGLPHDQASRTASLKRNLTAAADVFAYGCVVAEIYLGRAPFATDSQQQLGDGVTHWKTMGTRSRDAAVEKWLTRTTVTFTSDGPGRNIIQQTIAHP